MTTQPPSPPTTTSPPTATPFRPIFQTLLLACPLLILLPPRKLDLYTFSLAGAWVVSVEELTLGSSARRTTGMSGFWRGREDDGTAETGVDGEEEEGEGVKGLAKRLWMGDERPGWQRRRLEREREELERGKSYGDLIMEQVREVFPGFGGRGKGEGEGGEGEGEGGEGEER